MGRWLVGVGKCVCEFGNVYVILDCGRVRICMCIWACDMCGGWGMWTRYRLSSFWWGKCFNIYIIICDIYYIGRVLASVILAYVRL